jgi:cell division septum initiation protein DivIVA
MSDNADLKSGSVPEGPFEIAVRGYSRNQVDEFADRVRRRISDLEGSLSRERGEVERLRAELAAALQAPSPKPAHVELSERIAQILRLADEEAREQRSRAAEDIARLRSQAQQEADAMREEARTKVEQLLASARDQADRAVSSARAQAETTISAARAEAERSAAEAHRQAEAAIAGATAKARRVLEEATARADAVNGNAERRLAELTGRHTELMQRLTEMRDIVTGLVARDAAKGSLSDEVASIVAAALASTPAAGGSTKTAGSPVTPGTGGSAERRDAESPAPDMQQAPSDPQPASGPPKKGSAKD